MTGFRNRVLVVAGALILGVTSPLSAQTFPGGRVAPPDFGAAYVDIDRGVEVGTPYLDLDQVVQKPAGPPPTPRHTGVKAMVKDLVGDFAHLPSKENLFWAGVGGGLALAVHPIDDNVHDYYAARNPPGFFVLGKYLGESYVLLPTAVTVYVIGRAKDQPKVSHVGMDLIQSIAVAEALTQTLKLTTRRERPDESGKDSFPSGHSSDTFAFATALERHLGWKYAVPAYIFSSYVAMSRLPDNRHWVSDVVFGSAVGIISGRTVTRHGREFPLTVAAVPGGAAIMYVHRPRQ